jgi:hypothetical protein
MTTKHTSNTIVVRSSDTDVFILLLRFCSSITNTVLFDTGVGNKRRLLNITDLASTLGVDLCQALVGFHAFTGCDTTSAFLRKGKAKPLKLLQGNRKFCDSFQMFGRNPAVSERITNMLENFVCAMYGRPSYDDVDQLRHDLIIERYTANSGLLSDMEGTDLCYLPPCKTTLQKHIERSNYQAYIWHKSLIRSPILPSPEECGWARENNELHICWSDAKIVPDDLQMIADDSKEENVSESDCDEIEFDYFIDAMMEEEEEV